MTARTTPRGEVTSYTYSDKGLLASSNKPGGESYTFEPALAKPLTLDVEGRLVRAGAYVDPRGVRHEYELDVFGNPKTEKTVADGVTRVTKRVDVPELYSPLDDPPVGRRRNVIGRASFFAVNDIPLSPPVVFDLQGRPVSQNRIGGTSDTTIRRWTYAPDGWLLESYDGPSRIATRYERDASGHVCSARSTCSSASRRRLRPGARRRSRGAPTVSPRR
jgi:YD repeat-containing protein